MEQLGNSIFVIAVGTVLTLLAAGVSWIVSTLVSHASRISVLEEFKDETKAALARIEEKLDRLIEERSWRTDHPRLFSPPENGPNDA